ncbi:sulfite exporter TauE/SafE family protein [Paenibacillus sp. YN15]|nr:sulfite exporter TauE/SafE family protein [Paenibacillus sp. YN15]
MLLVGLLLGFIGAGGSGFMIAILTVGFGYPVHTAMGTALAAMMFTSLSGTVSQLRQKNTDLTSGLVVGLTGAIASWLGSGVAFSISPSHITWFTAAMLVLSSIVLWVRVTLTSEQPSTAVGKRDLRYFLCAVALGLVTGFLTGTFGIGSTPFIQVGLMLLLGLGMRTAAGTSMLVILPIAAAGGLGYYGEGGLDLHLLVTVLVGTMTGSYIGARFTKHASAKLLKTGMIATPIAAACLLLL